MCNTCMINHCQVTKVKHQHENFPTYDTHKKLSTHNLIYYAYIVSSKLTTTLHHTLGSINSYNYWQINYMVNKLSLQTESSLA